MTKEITTRPHKILLVITKSNWGGAQKYVYDLATELRLRGHETHVAVGGNGELIDRLQASNIPVHTLGKLKNNMNPFSSVFALFELVALYKKIRPNVVHLNSSKVGLFGALAGRVTRVPTIVFTAHGWPFNEERPRWQRALLRGLMLLTAYISHKVIAVSQKTLNDLRAPRSIRKKSTVVHNGIREISFKAATAFYEEKRTMRKEKVALVSIGELHPSKGFDLALSYLHNLTDLSWEWFILGEGKERAKLTGLIRNYNLEDRVHLIGHTKEAATYLESFDLFFLPSRTEALAYVVLEALQTNLPIVASNVGGIPEIIAHDTGSTLIDIRNKAATETLRQILSSPVQKVTDAERETLRKEFSLERMINKTVEVYQN